jgi:hypothetical protein
VASALGGDRAPASAALDAKVTVREPTASAALRLLHDSYVGSAELDLTSAAYSMAQGKVRV